MMLNIGEVEKRVFVEEEMEEVKKMTMDDIFNKETKKVIPKSNYFVNLTLTVNGNCLGFDKSANFFKELKDDIEKLNEIIKII
jgi:hypothetical protein